jgi:hypothetical protein
MEYDEIDGNVEIIGLDDLKIYISQNESQEIKRRRNVREALRALNVLSSINPLSWLSLIIGKTSLLDIYPYNGIFSSDGN